ncbi:AraC family transcriptional regulator [Flavobacterium sp. HJJ]|uniref:AraC family transcriptional regulator n=1 Tax=Flavobacterium sp. HJJ TaxID=2783792 RepID=UPI00188D1A62|nr:AraC family transcriptional regulator [Flavobacterium sp. HJJ]MBF4472761.1 helix-turn-helix domain-containing protein [Flavobacterium sp. HJJ]
MEIRNLYQPFELELLKIDNYENREHRNTFFEMVFVLEGEGTQMINNHKLPYASNKLFLIFPQDIHGFEVTTTTSFFFLRFNDSYLKTQPKEWIQKLELIFNNHNHLPGCILKNVSDKALIRALVEALIRENANPQFQQQEVIKQLINTIIIIASRNILLMPPTVTDKSKTDYSIQLLSYIHQNIYDPALLKSERIAERFNVSPKYISTFFKIHIGQTLQDYIITYKIKLIETRLRYTDMQINEIVYELGFSDSSHLNRLFKKYNGISPSEYKKMMDEKQTSF